MKDLAFLDSIRSSYDGAADGYAEVIRGDMADRPVDRALLGLFADLVPAGPVADIGCGTGRVTAFLDKLGVDVFGIDLSPGMLEQARLLAPGLRFEVGSMIDLELAAESLAGVIAWFSTIHLPEEHLPGVLAGFHRALRPGGLLMMAFQVGDEPRHFTQGWGREVDLTIYRRQPAAMIELLTGIGFQLDNTMIQHAAEPGQSSSPMAAYLIFRKPAEPAEAAMPAG